MIPPALAELDAFGRFEHAGWERVAHRYLDAWASLTGSFATPLLEAGGVAAGQRALDVACGPGIVTAGARDRGADPIGLDFSRAMIRQARSAHPDLAFVVGDAQRLPFGSGRFDRVLMNFGILHLSRPDRALAEARRVLAPGGLLAFTAWMDPDRNPGMRIVQDAVQAHAEPVEDLPRGPDPVLFADEERCREALADAGFATDSVRLAVVETRWRVPSPRFLFEAERDAGVRTAAVLARQSRERLDAIRAAVERGVSAYETPDGYVIPMTARVAVAAAGP